MDSCLFPIAGGFVLLSCVITFLWVLLARSRNDRIFSVRDVTLPRDDLEDHARKTAITHIVTNKRKLLNWPIPRMNDNYASILAVYRELNEELRKKHAVPGMAEWLLDNFYLIEEQSKLIRRDLLRKGYSRLPVLKSGALKGYTRIYAVATEFFLHTDCYVDEATLGNYLEAYQSHTILFEREIQAIPMVMSLAVLENIRRLCENIRETLAQRKKADELVDRWMANEDADAVTALERFMVGFGVADAGDSSFLEHVFYRLRRSGRSYATVLRRVDGRLAQFETDTARIAQREHATQSMDTISMGNCITSLRFLSSLDWSGLFETASFVERILNRDPDGTYPLMDLATRGLYRSKVEEYARAYGVSEPYIAKRVVALANEAFLARDPGAPEGSASARTWHVGYYLIGNGKMLLAGDRKEGRAASMVKNHPGRVYLGAIGLIVLLLSTIAAQHAALFAPSHAPLFGILAVLAVLLPASEIAVCAVNWVVCKALRPAVFPRLALEDGIPEEMSAMIVVPTLLPDAKRAAEILRDLEGHYLRNREKNLYFAMIGAFQDADSACSKDDEAIIQTGMAVVSELNAKYAKKGCDKFFYFHRESRFNEKSNRWFGWERKRGALMEFNDMVLGSLKTSFAYSSCATPPFSRIRYVITLDSDTILPMGMAKKLIGAMAHPLNQPVVDEKRGIVVDGYGLMQPRVDIDSESSGKTLFARIFAGHEGLDPYTNAISNVYQDLFGEGVFTGKGIYDLKVFQRVLKNAIPDNTVLSHDLLEGSYVRTGLLSDLRMIDSFPARYNSFIARMRRWVRGDWQLFPLIFNKIPTRSGKTIENPLSPLAKGKIFDNLRRSLIPPSLMVLVALGMSALPGNVFFWLCYFFAALGLPFAIAVIEYALSQRIASDRIKRHIPVVTGLKAAFLQLLLTLIFLPYQALLMVRAILVTLVRVFITKKNMLEWIPSADIEKSQVNTPRSYFREMGSSLVLAALTFLLAQAFKPEVTLICLPLLLIWVGAPLVAWYTSQEHGEATLQASGEDVLELRRIARKTWRYFEDLANAKNHFLPPDNYQVDPPRGIAHRTSPTNIGLCLLAILSARDFGYIGTGRMLELLEHSVSTIESLEKWNGHLYNWYDTYTLKPLRPGYVSTVDSGNYVGNLITLRQGLREHLSRPLLDSVFADGLIDTLRCADDEGIKSLEASPSFQALSAAWPADPVLWSRNLERFIQEYGVEDSRDSVWKNKAKGMAVMFRDELAEYLPYVDLLRNPLQNPKIVCALHEIAAGREEIVALLGKSVALKNLPAAYTRILGRINTQVKLAWRGEADVYQREFVWLGRLKESLIASRAAAENLIGRINRLAGRIDVLSAATRFLPLFSKKKQLFSIGFGVEDGQLTNSYYDLLASEARLTSYLSIARGEIPSEHWFRMGRALTAVDGYQGLVSWTGTMFEYLMPLLMMKSFKNSLLDETYSFVIRSQIKYGRQKDMPWGVSESGYNLLDQNHDYQYKAIGVPWLGLKRGLIEDTVVAPYAAFLALMVDPGKAIPNIARLKREGMEGSHGFYEAADYTPERLPFEAKKAVVKSFMAHHQGMSLASLNNCLHKNVLKTRFHADPEINAARFLLEEKIPSNLLFTKETQEKVVPFKEAVALEKQPTRRFTQPDPVLPRAHILTNGNYTAMITDRGTGFSKTRMAAVTRWRADSTLDAYGMFLYVRNLEADSVWSATYGPAQCDARTVRGGLHPGQGFF